MTNGRSVERIQRGVYRVRDAHGQRHIVYVAGSAGDWWAFSNGMVFHEVAGQRSPSKHPRGAGPQSLFAPMPATVIKVLVQPGSTISKGAVAVVLEAMKMELPVRAPSDGVVAAVHCREGELVQAGTALVDLT